MINKRNFSVDVRGITRDLVSHLAAVPCVKDLTTVAKFIDNNSSAVAAVIANFYLAQMSQQRACTITIVRNLISDLVNRKFTLNARDLTAEQLQEVKHAFFQAVATGYFARIPHSTGRWDKCILRRLSNDNYSIECQQQSAIELRKGVTRITVHTADRRTPVYERAY